MPKIEKRFLATLGMTNKRDHGFVIPSIARNLIHFIIALPTRFLTAFGMTN